MGDVPLIKSNILGVLTIILVAACSHQAKRTCQEIDWYELGRRDGLKSDGASGQDQLAHRKVKVVCDTSDPAASEAIYDNGFDAGIAVYCSPRNGFDLGRTGHSSAGTVCPSTMQDEFLRGIQRGLHYAELEKHHSDVDQRLTSLDQNLKNNPRDLAYQSLLRGEKIELEQKKRMLENQMSELEPDSPEIHSQQD